MLANVTGMGGLRKETQDGAEEEQCLAAFSAAGSRAVQASWPRGSLLALRRDTRALAQPVSAQSIQHCHCDQARSYPMPPHLALKPRGQTTAAEQPHLPHHSCAPRCLGLPWSCDPLGLPVPHSLYPKRKSACTGPPGSSLHPDPACPWPPHAPAATCSPNTRESGAVPSALRRDALKSISPICLSEQSRLCPAQPPQSPPDGWKICPTTKGTPGSGCFVHPEKSRQLCQTAATGQIARGCPPIGDGEKTLLHGRGIARGTKPG